MKALLAAGAGPNELDLNGSALLLVAANGQVEIAKALIPQVPDVEGEGEPARAHPSIPRRATIERR